MTEPIRFYVWFKLAAHASFETRVQGAALPQIEAYAWHTSMGYTYAEYVHHVVGWASVEGFKFVRLCTREEYDAYVATSKLPATKGGPALPDRPGTPCCPRCRSKLGYRYPYRRGSTCYNAFVLGLWDGRERLTEYSATLDAPAHAPPKTVRCRDCESRVSRPIAGPAPASSDWVAPTGLT